MATPYGIFRFPGIKKVISGTFTYNPHGITPSRAILTIPPQIGIPPEDGELVLEYGKNKIKFPNCLIDYANMKRNRGGYVVSIGILDRRWKWEFGDISGNYNERDEDGVLDFGTEKTPRELAELLLTAMGESGFEVGELPNDIAIRPRKLWVGANPAKELQILCRQLGCVVSLELDNKVRIRKKGEGADLPNHPNKISLSYDVNPYNRPDSIKFIGGRTIYQVRWNLIAVGEEIGGGILPINLLSYKPQAGWEFESPTHFYNVFAQHGAAARAAAVKSVWKWYSITSTVGGGKLSHHAADLYPDGLRPVTVDDTEPLIVGVHWPGTGKANAASCTGIGDIVDTDYQLDLKMGLIRFNEPVFRIIGNAATSSALFKEAVIYLETSFYSKSVNDPHGRIDADMWNRFELEINLTDNPKGTGPYVIRDDDVFRKVTVATYNGAAVGVITDNLDDCKQQALAIIEAKVAEFQTRESKTLEIAGLWGIDLDGARNQISWTFGPGGAKTKVGHNNEFIPISL